MLYRRRRGDRRYLHGDWRETDGTARWSVRSADSWCNYPVVGYLLAIVAGTLVAGLVYAVLKRPETEAVAKAA
jgi:fructose-specific phosphotransferase system IIC component